MIFEIIFVDDASTDNSANIISQLIKKDSRVRGFCLKKNTNKFGALVLGIQKAKNAIIVTADADLQDDPKEIYKTQRKN